MYSSMSPQVDKYLQVCEYENCYNFATGRCSGSVRQSIDGGEPFWGDCGKYFCKKHLKWGWGLPCVNGCKASPQCPKHHTGINCCAIL